jgi:hypothetical protein
MKLSELTLADLVALKKILKKRYDKTGLILDRNCLERCEDEIYRRLNSIQYE